jgi:hypothetical protein
VLLLLLQQPGLLRLLQLQLLLLKLRLLLLLLLSVAARHVTNERNVRISIRSRMPRWSLQGT